MGQCDRTRLSDRTYMYSSLERKLQRTPTVDISAKVYLDQNGHFTPQSHLIFSTFDVRMVDTILRMVALETDIPQLMAAYRLEVTPTKTNTARSIMSDLNAGTIGSGLHELFHERTDMILHFLGRVFQPHHVCTAEMIASHLEQKFLTMLGVSGV
jgi:hypothetical protein